MAVVRTAKAWLSLVAHHRAVSSLAFVAGFFLYLSVGAIWPKQYRGSALVELNPSANWGTGTNNQRRIASDQISHATTRLEWAGVVTRLHLFPERVSASGVDGAAEYLASRVTIQQTAVSGSGGLAVRVGYVDSDQGRALRVTSAVVENLIRPVPDGESSTALPQIAVPAAADKPTVEEPGGPSSLEASVMPPSDREQPVAGGRGLIGGVTAASAGASAKKLAGNLAEGERLQKESSESTAALDSLREELSQVERRTTGNARAPKAARSVDEELKVAAPNADAHSDHLRQELEREERSLAELRERYTEDYPDVAAAKERVHDLQLDLDRISAAAPKPPPMEAVRRNVPEAAAASAASMADAEERQKILRKINEEEGRHGRIEAAIARNRARVAQLRAQPALQERDATMAPVPESAAAAVPVPSHTAVDVPPSPDPESLSNSTDANSASPGALASGVAAVSPLTLAQSPTVTMAPAIFAEPFLFLLGILCGTLAALLAAWIVEMRDPSIRTEGMLRHEVPVSAIYLGGIPRVRHEAVSE